MHSTYSDGYLTPTELAEKIVGYGIKIAALTDHNTVGGLDEFRRACAARKIKSVAGLELYVKLDQVRFNLLWYNFDDKDPDLHKMLRLSQLRRKASVRKILKKLVVCGFRMDAEATLDRYNHYIPINHLVDDMVADRANRVRIVKELGDHFREEDVIRAYFYNKEIGQLRESYLNIHQVLALRKKIGGQLVLNHPGKYNQLSRAFLEKLKKIGIDGVEVLSPHHSIGAVMYAQFIADKLKFIMTGGTDFHRFEENSVFLQNPWEYFQIDSKYLKRVEEIIGRG